MAKGKTASSKSASAQKINAGGSGKMHKFSGAGPQAPGVTATTERKGKGAKFVKAGSAGKMQKFSPVTAQKSGRSGQK